MSPAVGGDWTPSSRTARSDFRHQPLLTWQRFNRKDVHVHCPLMPGSAIRALGGVFSLDRSTQHFSLGLIALIFIGLVMLEVSALQTLSRAGSLDQRRPGSEERTLHCEGAGKCPAWRATRRDVAISQLAIAAERNRGIRPRRGTRNERG